MGLDQRLTLGKIKLRRPESATQGVYGGEAAIGAAIIGQLVIEVQNQPGDLGQGDVLRAQTGGELGGAEVVGGPDGRFVHEQAVAEPCGDHDGAVRGGHQEGWGHPAPVSC